MRKFSLPFDNVVCVFFVVCATFSRQALRVPFSGKPHPLKPLPPALAIRLSLDSITGYVCQDLGVLWPTTPDHVISMSQPMAQRFIG